MNCVHYRTLGLLIQLAGKNKTNNKSLPFVGTKEERKEKEMFYCSDIIVGFSQAGQLRTHCMYRLVGSAPCSYATGSKGMSGCGVYLLFVLAPTLGLLCRRAVALLTLPGFFPGFTNNFAYYIHQRAAIIPY